MIEAAHVSCRLLNSDKSMTQKEAMMAGIISTGVNMEGKTNSTKQSVQEYIEIMTKCGFDPE